MLLFENLTQYLTSVRLSNKLPSTDVYAQEWRLSMKTIPLSKAQFDVKAGDLDALARDWAERECTSFDEAVRRAGGAPENDGSIWDMPTIDSKTVVSLLAEL